jgi:hypothetical protein
MKESQQTSQVAYNADTLEKLLAISEEYVKGVSVDAQVVVRGSKGFKMLLSGNILALPSATIPQEFLVVGETLPCIFRESGGSIRATLDVAAARAACQAK